MTISTSPFAQTYSITKLIEDKINKAQVQKIYFIPAWTRGKVAAGVTATIENQTIIYSIIRELFHGLDIYALGSSTVNEIFQGLADIFEWRSPVLNSEDLDKSKVVFNDREILLPSVLFDEENLFVNYCVPVPHKDLLVSGAIANTAQLLTKNDRDYYKSLLEDEGLMFLGHLASNCKAQFINIMEVVDIFKIDTFSLDNLDPLEQYAKMHILAKDKSYYSKEELGEFWISNSAKELDLYAFYKIWNGMPVREGSWFYIPPEKDKKTEIKEVEQIKIEEKPEEKIQTNEQPAQETLLNKNNEENISENEQELG